MESQLKFVASLFKMAIKEFHNVMGPESIQTIFRLMGETQGERVERVMRKKYKTDSWTTDEFIPKLVKDLIEPTLGEGNVEYKIDGNEITLSLAVCPFQRAGMSITSKLYCTYTEGMIETAIQKALKNIEFTTKELKASGNKNCVFQINVK